MSLNHRVIRYLVVVMSLLSAVLVVAATTALLSSTPAEHKAVATTSLYYLGLVIVALAATSMLAISYWIRRVLLSRLIKLDEAVSRIRQTGKREPLALPGDDELSSLADNVDSLVSELEQAREELGQRVRERTAELSRAVEDLTAQVDRREQAEFAKELSEQRYRSLIENLSDVVFTMSPDGVLSYVSTAVEGMFGLTPEELVGKHIEAVLGAKAADQVLRRVKRGLSAGGSQLTVDGCGYGSSLIDLDVILSPSAHSGAIQGILRDVTARRRHENELLHMASHDFLTGLANRRRFEDLLAQVLQAAERGEGSGAVLWLDLDNFKDVNDTLGHKAGDELLTAVSQRLSKSVRSDCLVARLGGDEFAVLVPSVDEAGAREVADRLMQAIADVRLDVEGQMVRVSSSMGVVLYPEHGVEVEDLLAHADIAMYMAKEHGRSQVNVYDVRETWVSRVEDTRAWSELVETALTQDGLVVFAQPIRELGSGDLVSFELLVRIAGLDGEVIMPDRFLPVAERTGMIVDIDLWVLGQACEVLNANADETFRLNVNASARTLSDPRYLNGLADLIGSAKFDPSRLTIEITETAIIVDVASINDTLKRIKSLGCRIALDDFGSGFTSFLHLKQLPVDDIKIDGSFVRNVFDSQNDQHMVRAMVEMAKGLDMRTTAEFVESSTNMDILRELGVEMVQGYAIGLPAPAADIWPRRDDGLPTEPTDDSMTA